MFNTLLPFWTTQPQEEREKNVCELRGIESRFGKIKLLSTMMMIPLAVQKNFAFTIIWKTLFFSLFVVTFILSLDNCDIFKRYAYLGLLSSHHPRSYLILLTNIVMIVRSNDAKQKILSSDKLSIFNFLIFFLFIGLVSALIEF